jgi:DNA mismatch repair ATPase MutS
MARYAYEHPAYVWPTVLESGAVFHARQLTHPLLPAATASPNSIDIDARHRLYVVSGSNMSGKSTLLRTIGINTVLALAGAPTPASALTVGPLHVGASLHTSDSLQAGISRFYAEILRLRQIVDLAKEHVPTLFLLDEILHGTNSHDRTIGAEAVVRAMLKSGAVGLVTTHDLALARIAEDESLAAVNVHFSEQMVEGKMVFDYHLQNGVVERSNALELMRAVGLEV